MSDARRLEIFTGDKSRGDSLISIVGSVACRLSRDSLHNQIMHRVLLFLLIKVRVFDIPENILALKQRNIGITRRQVSEFQSAKSRKPNDEEKEFEVVTGDEIISAFPQPCDYRSSCRFQCYQRCSYRDSSLPSSIDLFLRRESAHWCFYLSLHAGGRFN